MTWWNANYLYRKPVPVVNNETSSLAAGYAVEFTFDMDALTPSKMQDDGDDLRIVYWDGDSWNELDRHVVNVNTSATIVTFKTQASIAGSGTDNNYYMYYGYSGATSPPSNKANIYDYWSDFDDVTGWTVDHGTFTASSSILQVGGSANGWGWRSMGTDGATRYKQLKVYANCAPSSWDGTRSQFFGLQQSPVTAWYCPVNCCGGTGNPKHFITISTGTSTSTIKSDIDNQSQPASPDIGTGWTPTNAYNIYKMQWGNGQNKVYQDTTLKGSSTKTVGVSGQTMYISIWNDSTINPLYIDWVAYSPYTHNEPTITLGTEEGNSTGVWKDQDGGSSLYAAINEESWIDSTYVWNEYPTVGDYFEVGLSNPGYIPVEGAHTLRWRGAKIAGGLTITMKCELKQGDTVIATDQHELTSSYQTFEYSLTQGEMDNITDYDDLRLRFTVVSIV